jgi:uncharacterized protein (DUF427 family)
MPPRPEPTKPGQESVWDFPRPARFEPTTRRIRIVFAGITIADTRSAIRAIETSHPPSYYLPPSDIRMEALTRTERSSVCEWKGQAAYYTLSFGGRQAIDCAWAYPSPTPAFAAIAGHLAFYAGPMDACFVDDERVTPQEGRFYGGWITSHVAGPFKGAPGSMGW